ncbi:2-succinyl-5-enolpyruvyl-6-hydroxy-3-cyclohexene-1-carboxylic-acid synthase [Poritiphilus flavus]|uniref:2-succinyl-5-enolpyruvyl-6-hydroxy-3-cyclohexene-1-carboxylate synthase n=1 Tax=Poritiphilus flavus TaxID=2697053 RepID=A0A6L9EFA1_9FLAO|nr:2-succinyl-5-enolpyruvyl-6-hydroxy-3-cyclohexene-1-carboxylic-acid synthase [Poritiphilus flavus]NAS13444.1 2-succinyl-5-enolpyruvyl-6-hydroxy-3-cyclohexene-1-carboxylic-acid synthase [Poritiphilus flavus]
MKYSNIPAAQSVVYHCKARAVKDIVISPGSRNAPLTIGFTEDPFFNCYSIVDERCAAFFALGIAQQTGRPVAVVCTSGSAVLNYFPAVSEAFYSDIPMLVISADRPPKKIDIGDGQTIRQENVFGHLIGYSANLKLDCRAEEYSEETLSNPEISKKQEEVQHHNDGELNKAFNIAIKDKCPVHINVPFEEPLYEKFTEMSVSPVVLESDEVSGQRDSLSDLDQFAEIWNSSSRKMILVGVSSPGALDQDVLDALGNDPTVLVLTETTSNLHHPNFFPSIDSIVAPIEKSEDKDGLFSDLQPEVLLTFGGMIVSKKIKAFLRNYQPSHHWHIDTKKAYDTFFCLSNHFVSGANDFFKAFLPLCKTSEEGYYSRWESVRQRYLAKRSEYLGQIPFSDLKVFQHIQGTIPKGYQVHLANSSTVRYSQLMDMDASLRVFSNRGTSGIDGSTSTAIGGALYDTNPTLLISGDLSFLYDSNALWNNYIRADFRMIVINNEGGGIFRILPGKEETNNFKDYFETVHKLDFARLCALYNIDHSLVTDEEGLSRELSGFYEPSHTPKLLEIRTPRDQNDKILLTYFDFLS